jgi:signal transduction histidine kinase
MQSIINLLKDHKNPIIQLAEKWRWIGILFIGSSLFFLEVYEDIKLNSLHQPLHLSETILYAFLLLSAGLLFELFVRVNQSNKKLLSVLEFKHKLSLELLFIDDLESLIEKLVELPGKITFVEEAYLLVHAPDNNKFDVAGHWKSAALAEQEEWDLIIPCPKCLEKTSDTYNFHMCRENNESSQGIYSLGIVNTNYPTALIRFKMRADAHLQQDQKKIFENIGDEIAVAIRSAQDRKRLSEMRAAEVAMAERRAIFGYVHDQLGQNLGYLQLKLDQFSSDENMTQPSPERSDLKKLRDVANQSYDIVRDILKKMQTDSIPNFPNLLKEHARVVSERAKFSLNFNSIGKPVKLLPDIQQIIFLAFGEILSNIEKHSRANRVDVLLTWSEDFFDITVADNGIGFETSLVRKDEHFGLEIMNERISYFSGKLMVDSASDFGTVISISMPLRLSVKVPHEH